MYKMLVLDFDDTLLTDDLTISEENIKAMKRAKEEGMTILFCSGRSNDSMMPFIKMMDTHDDHEFFISYNGGRIDRINGENIYLQALDGELLKDLISIGHEFDVTTQLYHDGFLVVEEENSYTRVYQERTNMKVKVEKDILSLPYSIKVLYHNDDPTILEAIQKEVIKRHDDLVNTFFSKTMYMEVLHKDVNKGLATKYMAERLGIKQEEVIAVGDGFNDVFMLDYAGLGVAVQNSKQAIKDRANYVTKATNNESPIAEVLNKFVFKD